MFHWRSGAKKWVRGIIIVVVQSLSRVQLFVTPWIAACQASLSFTISWTLLKLVSIESVIPFNHFMLCHPLLLLLSVFPSIRVFSNEWAHRIRGPKRSSRGITNEAVNCLILVSLFWAISHQFFFFCPLFWAVSLPYLKNWSRESKQNTLDSNLFVLESSTHCFPCLLLAFTSGKLETSSCIKYNRNLLFTWFLWNLYYVGPFCQI